MVDQNTIPDWRALDREALGIAFNNAVAVEDSAAILANWEARSLALRAARGVQPLIYGPRPRNRIDFLLARAGAPTLLFIHGGYWQMRAKETFTFIAEGPLARGISVALAGYTLAPDATLADMVLEIRAALDCLTAELPGLGGDPSHIWLSGWSAGAHLAVSAMDHDAVRGCMAISGLYDLESIRHCWINGNLGLDADAAFAQSPIHHVSGDTVPVSIAWGGAELPLMRKQSDDYATACIAQGCEATVCEIAERNHFTILEELSHPLGVLAITLNEMIAG